MAKDLVKDFFERDLSDAELEALQERLASSEEALRFSAEAERFHRGLGAAAAVALKLAQAGKAGGFWSTGLGLAGKSAALKAVLVLAGGGLIALGGVQAYQAYHQPEGAPVAQALPQPVAAAPKPLAGARGKQVALKLDLEAPARVTAMVLDEEKRLVRDLGTRDMAAGPQRLVWDGYDDQGQVPRPGRYQVVLRWNGKEAGKWVELRPAH